MPAQRFAIQQQRQRAVAMLPDNDLGACMHLSFLAFFLDLQPAIVILHNPVVGDLPFVLQAKHLVQIQP